MAEREEMLSRVEAAAAPVLAAHGLVLVDAEWRRGGRRGALRFFVDKPGGVGIEDCQRLSRELGDVLDVAAIVEEPYDLEVSSPGLDRELRKDRELQWALGKEVRCWVRQPVSGRTEFTGRLSEVADEWLRLAEPGGGSVEVPREFVTKMRLVPDLGRRGRTE